MNTVSLILAVRCLFQDSFKNVWAGMWGGGINFLSHESSYFNVYSYSPIPAFRVVA